MREWDSPADNSGYDNTYRLIKVFIPDICLSGLWLA
jgi:hypothetical protein